MSAAVDGDAPLVSTQTMARTLNISAVHLGRMVRDGRLPGPVGRGRWNIAAVASAYIADIESRVKDDLAGVKAEELRLLSARREKAEAETEQQRMKNAEMRAELLPRGEVDSAVTAAFARVRAKVLALPSKMAPVLATMRTVPELREAMAEAIHGALDELSATSIAGVPGPDWSFAGHAGGGSGVVAGDGSAAGADREPVGRPRKAAKPRGQRRAGEVGHQPG